jgi:hypothetical protein
VNFVVARNLDPDSRLPYLVRLPIDDGLILKVRDTWPRASRGREGLFWQTRKVVTTARPGARIPGRRASGNIELVIVVDTREQYPYRFSKQQATTVRSALSAGDYAVRTAEGTPVVEDRYGNLLKHAYAPAGFPVSRRGAGRVRIRATPRATAACGGSRTACSAAATASAASNVVGGSRVSIGSGTNAW